MTPKIHKIQTASELFETDESLHKLQRKLEAVLTLPTDFHSFHDLCGTVIHDFAEFVQKLPPIHESAYTLSNSTLLKLSFDRACQAVKRCRHRLFLNEDLTDSSSKAALWLYVVFTAALFHRLGYILTKFEITLCDNTQYKKKHWDPLLEPHLRKTKFTHYSYQFGDNIAVETGNALTVLYAYNLIPKIGLEWIAEDKRVFDIWIMLLLEENRQHTGPLELFLSHFRDFIYEAHMESMLALSKHDRKKTFLHHFDTQDPNAVDGAVAFLEWLEKNITGQHILFNTEKAALHRTKEGVVIILPDGKDLMKKFLSLSDNKKFGNPDNIIKQLHRLGVTHTDGKNNSIRQFQVKDTIKKGLLINPHAIQQIGTAAKPQERIPFPYSQVPIEVIPSQTNASDLIPASTPTNQHTPPFTKG